MKISNPIGKKGEDLAVQFLKSKGYKILERNYRKQYGEIDIIAIDTKENVLVFIEVKTRTSHQYGTPLEAITNFKLKPMLKTIQLYIVEHKGLPESLRIDAISIEIMGTETNIEHITNITSF